MTPIDPHSRHAEGLLRYIDQSPSPFHAAHTAAGMLVQAGYEELDPGEAPRRMHAGDVGFVLREGSLLAYRVGSASPAVAGFRVIGAHTDSPNLRVKPRPDLAAEGYRQVAVEPYGGAIFATWMDRDLGLSGRVVVKDSEGRPRSMLFRWDEPMARIPNLAIHLNREVNREGLQLNAQKHLPPVVGLGAWGGLASWMARRLDVEAVLSWELGFHEIGASRRGGLDGEFLFAPRLDNLGSCYPAIAALLEVGTSEATQIVALFDHEEIGSRTWRGALSPMLRNLMNHILEQHEDAQPGGLPRAAVHSWMVSSDMTHGVHPNYADRHEPDHKPRMNGGPAIKTHVCGNYATDAGSSAFFRLAADEAGVKVQDFVVKSDLPCGSTIGPLTATELGIRTVDVGNPMLSMHSAREQAGIADVADMVAVMGRCLVR